MLPFGVIGCCLLEYFLQYLYFPLLKCSEVSIAFKVRISRYVSLVVAVSGPHKLRQNLTAWELILSRGSAK